MAIDISAMRSDAGGVGRVLRVHAEPYEYVDEWTVHRVLSERPGEYLAWIGRVLGRLATGHGTIERPVKQIFSDPTGGGDFRVMPCVIRCDDRVVKTVKLVGTNVTRKKVPDQITVGKAFRLDAEENFITHVFEACLLTSARTGACAALAIDKLARRRKRVTVIGAGRVGFYAALYAATLEGVEEIALSDLNVERAAATAEAVGQLAPKGVRCMAIEREEHLTSDVVVSATTSRDALMSPRDVLAGLVVSVGADSYDQHELSDEWPGVADLFVDVMDSVHVGDLRHWIAKGLLAEGRLTDLFTLFRGGRELGGGRPRLFISTGSAIFDNLTMGYLLERLPGAK